MNELIPELSAPGTNIIQAEGCVSSGGCNNFLGGDASGNTYTGRGSGTSYATPAVTGVVALVIEANGQLSPLQIKEVLKQTSERMGEPSAPEVDPYWNREFGYGMVDAHAAVALAQHIAETGQTDSLDVSLQNHLLNLVDSNGTINVTGHAWGQMGSVDRVEFRIDGGEWHEATYSAEPAEIGALTPFSWHVILDPTKLGEGPHQIEVRAVSGENHSLPVLATAHGTAGSASNFSVPPLVIFGIVVVFVIWLASLSLVRLRSDGEIDSLLSRWRREEDSAVEEVLEAELIPEQDPE